MQVATGNQNLPIHPPLHRGGQTGAFQLLQAHHLQAADPHPVISAPTIEGGHADEPRWKPFAKAAGFFLAAVLLRHAPMRPSGYKLIPTDWKQWVKVGLGIAGIREINKGLEWNPPLWLGAVQMVSILMPLLQGRGTSLKQMGILAPLVAGLVQGTDWASKRAEPFLEEKLHVPPAITRVALSVTSTVIGILVFHRLLGNAAGGAVVCARCGGCSSVVCASEVGEYAGAFKNWHDQREVIEA